MNVEGGGHSKSPLRADQSPVDPKLKRLEEFHGLIGNFDVEESLHPLRGGPLR